MGKIVILADSLCNQIAAGEVVERPAAVVKELVENSVDAQARKVSVTLHEGGRKEIRVTDNGSGMSPDDALLALERHATSKIRTIEDLQSIQSLGFRGEALPSIASVSRFELITREPDALSGVSVRVEGGVLRDVRETGCPAGTIITVRDLFYNIPVRRKFLRSVDTETSHISDQFLRLSMAHPEIHLQLSHHERLHYDFPQTGSYSERAGQIFGTQLVESLRPFSARSSSANIHGLAGPPELHRTSSRSLFVYVNGRPVRDRALNHAILTAYETLLPRGKFPMVTLFVEVPPDLVDVNVHPTKREVRFRSPGEVMESVRNAIRKALEDGQAHGRLYDPGRLAPERDARSRSASPGTAEGRMSLERVFDDSLHRNTPSPPVQMNAFPSLLPQYGEERRGDPEGEPPPGGELLFSRLPVLGQLANTYILLEAPDALILIDQHAAHERILYDGLASSPPGESGRQRLARSAVLELFPREAAMLRRWMEHLSEIGFEIEAFGGDSFMIQAVPAILSEFSPDVLIRELIETAHEEEKTPRWDILIGLARAASCRSAVRAGQKLQREEIRCLLDALDRTRVSSTCPHGRPLWCRLTLAEIARLFFRT